MVAGDVGAVWPWACGRHCTPFSEQLGGDLPSCGDTVRVALARMAPLRGLQLLLLLY